MMSIRVLAACRREAEEEEEIFNQPYLFVTQVTRQTGVSIFICTRPTVSSILKTRPTAKATTNDSHFHFSFLRVLEVEVGTSTEPQPQ